VINHSDSLKLSYAVQAAESSMSVAGERLLTIGVPELLSTVQAASGCPVMME
jgi:hypothetical protein